MSSTVPNPFGGPPLDVNPDYGTQPAKPWSDKPTTVVIRKPKGGRKTKRTKRSKRRNRLRT